MLQESKIATATVTISVLTDTDLDGIPDDNDNDIDGWVVKHNWLETDGNDYPTTRPR